MVRHAYRRLRNLLWRTSRYRSDASPIIVGGCGRSGTTLVRVILDTHSRICCGPESGLLAPGVPTDHDLRRLSTNFDLDLAAIRELRTTSRSQAEFVDRFFAFYAKTCGVPRWADKTPRNVRYAPWILRHFPKAKFVHVIRDGRDVIASLRTHPRHRVVDGQLVATGIRRPIEPCIRRWVDDVQHGLALRDDPRYIEIRYEALISDPESTLRGLFDRLGEPWEPAVLRFHEVQSSSRDPIRFPQNEQATRPLSTQAVGRWHEDLTAEEMELFHKSADHLMARLGYDYARIDPDARSLSTEPPQTKVSRVDRVE